MSVSTRLIVKNLPKHVDEGRLRAHFEAKGAVTDCKVMRTPDGRTRRFAFVGFRSEREAKEAKAFFHRTFLDTSRLEVAFALGIGASELPRPWSKYSDGSSAKERALQRESERQERAEAKRRQKEERAKGKEDKGKAKEGKGKAKEGKGKDGKGGNAMRTAAKWTKGARMDVDDVDDPKLREFLAAMQPRTAARFWANDDAHPPEPNAPRASAKPKQQPKGKDAPKRAKGEDAREERGKAEEEGQGKGRVGVREATVHEVANRKHGGEGLTVKRLHVVFDDDDDGDGEDDEDYQDLPAAKPRQETDAAGHGHDQGGGDEQSDDDDEEEEDDEDQDEAAPRHEGESEGESEDESEGQGKDEADAEADANEEADEEAARGEEEEAAETGRLFVRNLMFSTSEDDLTALFTKHGTVLEVHLPLDKESKQGKGFAYVQMSTPAEAAAARAALDGAIFSGRLLHILPAKPKRETKQSALTDSDKRKERRKAESMQERAWNSLFIRQDTVAAAAAAKLGVSKSELLSAEGDGSAAVRVALSETSLIQETKQMLDKEGVDISALDPSQRAHRERSTTTLLIKNLPFDTQEDELEELCARYGSVVRFVLPPTRTLAIVEYSVGTEAKAAFRHLAFHSFKHVPLLLEWAPAGLFNKAPRPRKRKRAHDDQEGEDGQGAGEGAGEGAGGKQGGEEGKGPGGEEEEDDEDEGKVSNARTIFVKNLSFQTTPPMLGKAFEELGLAVASATVPQKKAVGQGHPQGGKPAMQGMGYGFVVFRTQKDTERALRQRGVMVDGRAIEMRRSERVVAASKEEGKGKRFAETHATSSKLMVRNIPFEASKREVRELFASLSEIKSVRLPKKMDGGHRGFAFVECATRKEASKAMEMLRNTHLYGRHLVIEYAKQDEGVEELREKVAAQVARQQRQGGDAKRRRVQAQDNDNDDDDDDGFIPL